MTNKIEENKIRGYISLYRSLKNWEWYDDVNVSRVFIHLLLSCNWKPKKWKGNFIDRGEIITSIPTLALETNLTIKQVRLVIKKLESTQEVVTQTTNKYTKITICNFSKYQDYDDVVNDEEDIQKADKGQGKGTQKADKGQGKGTQKADKGQQLNKENNITIKKENKEKEIFENFRIKYKGKKRGLDTEFNNFVKKHSDWKNILPKLVIAIELQIKEREIIKKNDPKAFIPEWKNLSTWINQRCWEEEIGEIELNEDELTYMPVSPEIPDEEFDKFYDEMEFNKPIFDLEKIIGN